MGWLGGMALGAVCGVMALVVLVWLEATLLKSLLVSFGGKELSTLTAAVAVLLAGAFQGCASGLLVGADGGLLGLVVGIGAWSAVVALIGGLDFGRAVGVGIVWAIVHWLLAALFLVLFGAALLGGAAGAAVFGG